MLRVVVCVSGGGTNLQAMIDGIKEGRINNAGIVRVISNNRDAYALKRAEENHIPGVCISPKDYAASGEGEAPGRQLACRFICRCLILWLFAGEPVDRH